MSQNEGSPHSKTRTKKFIIKKAPAPTANNQQQPLQFSNPPRQIDGGKRVVVARKVTDSSEVTDSSSSSSSAASASSATRRPASSTKPGSASSRGPRRDEQGNVLEYTVLGSVDEYMDARIKQTQAIRRASLAAMGKSVGGSKSGSRGATPSPPPPDMAALAAAAAAAQAAGLIPPQSASALANGALTIPLPPREPGDDADMVRSDTSLRFVDNLIIRSHCCRPPQIPVHSWLVWSCLLIIFP